MEGVISVFRSKVLQLHTTRSWDFMGLALDTGEATPLQLKYGDDVVVGIFDTGTVFSPPIYICYHNKLFYSCYTNTISIQEKKFKFRFNS